jgi:methylenetetrahydrofolate reductase (NADPH)
LEPAWGILNPAVERVQLPDLRKPGGGFTWLIIFIRPRGSGAMADSHPGKSLLRNSAPATGHKTVTTKLGFWEVSLDNSALVQLIHDIYAAKRAASRPVISFEFSPPKTDEGDRSLLEKHVPALAQARPGFCSVTYGAGGGTRDKTLMIVERIQREHQLTTLAHLTCVNHTREEVGAILEKIRALGCKNILALRGDPPGGGEFQKTPGGFEFAAQLVKLIREAGDFSIGVAGFPEGHIACPDGKHADWRHLQEKVAAGADFVLTQLFFDNADFFAFRDFVADKLGVRVPLVPGVVPIVSAPGIINFSRKCGAKIPPALRLKLDQLADDDAAAAEFGIEYATRQCAELLRAGVPGFHFYTLNKSRATVQVLKNLGLA